MNIIKQAWLAWWWGRRANRVIAKLQAAEDRNEIADHGQLLKYLSHDNKLTRKNKLPCLRAKVLLFYSRARTIIKYRVKDYSDAKAHYKRLTDLGVIMGLNGAFYEGRWVTCVSSWYAERGKTYESYWEGGWCTPHDEFKPFTFLVDRAYGDTLGDGGNGMGCHKNQCRLATKEEIEAIVEMQFIKGSE